MRGVGHQRRSLEPMREEALAEGAALGVGHLAEPCALPGRVLRLDDEGAHPLVELIRMGLEPAVRGLDEVEGEGVEGARGAEPGIAAVAEVDLGAEGRGVAIAEFAVHPIGGDDEVHRLVVHALFEGVRYRGLEAEGDAEGAAALLEDLEEAFATDPAEAMAAGAVGAPADMDRDVVPPVEGRADRGAALGVRGAEVADGLVGEDDPPAEGVVGAVPLLDHDLGLRVSTLEEERGIEPPGSPSDHQHAH